MEIFKKPFVQVTVPPFNRQNSQNGIKAEKLLSLIDNEEYKQFIAQHYNLNNLDFIILVDNIDVAFKYVEYVHNKYRYVNLWASNNNVDAYFNQPEDETLKPELFFKFDSLYDDEGLVHENINAKVEYDASSMFFEDRELSKYINYLKSKNNKSLSNLEDRNILINDITTSWKRQYKRNPNSIHERKFRFLKESSDEYFLRSITSQRYKEYGVAFSFVISMLSLHKAMEKDKGLNLSISSLSLNESKIDMLISTGHSVLIKEIDQFITSTILIKNNDLGDRALSFTHSLKLTPVQNDEKKIYLFPKLNDNKIEYKLAISHTAGIDTVLKTFDHLHSAIYSIDEYAKDFSGIAKTHAPDQLRAKIEEKIVSNNSPYKGVQQLRDLFKRSTAQHIDNLAKLLEICQKAEMIDMEYDLKFKLRYLISNVLLYGKN